MTWDEVSEERMEALLAGEPPRTPEEEGLARLVAEMRAEAPAGAPATLRERVRRLEPSASPLARLRDALQSPATRRSAMVLAPACTLAVAVGIVIGLGQVDGATQPAAGDTGVELNAAPEVAPAPRGRSSDTPAAGPDAPGAPSMAARAPEGISVTGIARRTLADGATAAERRAAYREALADALAEARRKAEALAGRAGLTLGEPRLVSEESGPAAPCRPPAGGAGAPGPEPCTVTARVGVTYGVG
jgi:hypothetical protein